MMKDFYFAASGFVLSATVLWVGCGPSDQAPQAAAPAKSEPADAHPTTGPHDGALIELGNEEYHAELVHDEAAGTVTVYLLDASAKRRVPIDATELVVNLSHEGKAEQFKLAASPDADDSTGKSSRFTSDDAELAAELDHDHGQAQLVVAIDGKQFRGAIAHDHDEHGHEDHNQ